MERIALRPLAAVDLSSLLSIQRSSPGAAQWTPAEFESVTRGDFAGWVAELDGRLVGFLVARQVAGEVEILNLAVAPDARRAGVGSRLLENALATAWRTGTRRAFLEVRESNAAAQAFYRRHGFSVHGRRRDYYSHPREDALVFGRALAPQA